MFIFDTRRVNQHFRGGHGVVRCQLLRLGLDLHLTESDVNNVSHRILATPGMFEYFILPSVSTQLLLREGGDVPDHLLHLSDV